MAKAIVSIVNTDIDDNNRVRLIYKVVVLGPPHHVYGEDFPIDPEQSLETNLSTLQSKIARNGDGAKPLARGDVIIFGAPVVKDEASLKDSTNGITSDSATATKVDSIVDVKIQPLMAELPAEKGLWARSVDYVKSLWS